MDPKSVITISQLFSSNESKNLIRKNYRRDNVRLRSLSRIKLVLVNNITLFLTSDYSSINLKIFDSIICLKF